MTSTSGASATATSGDESSSTSTTSEVEPLCGDGIAVPGEFCYELGPSGGIAGVIPTLGVGDVNGDGRDDLIAGSNTGRRFIYVVEGDTLVPGEVLETPGGSVQAIVVEDIDGDGVNELLSAVGDAVEIHSTDGGSLQLMSTVPLPGNSLDLEVADIDGDGALDLVANAWSAGDLVVLRGDGEGGFAAWQQLAVGPRPRGMKVADLDSDGAPEVVVALESCQGGWLDPESTCMAPEPTTKLTGSPWLPSPGVGKIVRRQGGALASLEINGDGVPDFVVADLPEEALHLVLSNP